MADDNNATRYGVDAGLGVLGLVLGVATGDKELTRAAYKSTSDTTRTLAGSQPPSPAYEPPRQQLPGKVETVVLPPKAPPAVSAAPDASSSGRFDPFTLEPR